MKKLISMILALMLTASLMAPAMATGTTPKHMDKAEILYQLGLFKGTGVNSDGTPIFDLDKGATRIQGLVMLIRLLGEEEAALACEAECPFSDVPSWAEKYVAYAYDMGYTKGVSKTAFGSEDKLQGKAFVTFVLRALGYDDANGDFTYNGALTFGAELGLLESGTCEGALYRDDCALLSYNAMRARMKGTDTKLMDKLVNDGVLTDAAVQMSGILLGKVSVPVTVTTENGKYVFEFSGKDILDAFPDAAYIDNSGWGGTTAEAFRKMVMTPVGVALGSGDFRDFQEGRRPDRPALTPTRTAKFEFRGGNNLLILSVFDIDFNLLAYCAFAPGYSDASATEILFTTCNYNGKEDLKRIEKVIGNVRELDEDAVYLEKIVTTAEDGTESIEQYLRVDESKWPAGIGTATYYSLSNERDRESMLRAYTSFGRDFLSFGVDQQNGNKFDGELYLYIFNEARDIVACVRLPKELTVMETSV